MKTCIFFSDETWSALSNNVISQHYKYWYSKNPHLIHEIPVYVLKSEPGVQCVCAKL